MKKFVMIMMLTLFSSGLLAACGSNTSNTSSDSSDITSTVADSTETTSTISDSTGLSQDVTYRFLQESGYTGLSKFDETYGGLDEAVMSQSANYVVIGRIKDVEAVKSLSAYARNLNLQEGQWFYATSVKAGTLSSVESLSKIQ